MTNVFSTLKERGFVKQTTDEAKIAEILEAGEVTFYVGVDATADSMHVGHLMPVMAMSHLQRAGHKPIAVVGGGTSMVGDPTGKTEMRQMLSRQAIDANVRGIKSQFQRYLDLDGGKGAFANNADWLLDLGYVDFLREIGRHFRVNEMLRMETYKARLDREDGLSFIEFNYLLLQSYDFLRLYQDHGCTLQFGGDDQWSNILGGVDLVRRVEGAEVYGATIPLLTTAQGVKMGKTEKGTVWLDVQRTQPYEFFQFWINTDDRDVERFLGLFTFLPMDEVRQLGALQGAEINEAKRVLAYEATALTHGKKEAEKAKNAFADAKKGGGDLSAIPSTVIEPSRLQEGIPVLDLFAETGLAKSKSEARRLVQQGGAYINGDGVASIDVVVDSSLVRDGAILLRFGKKKYHRVVPG